VQQRPPRGRLACPPVAAALVAAAAIALSATGIHSARAESFSAKMIEPNANFRSWKFDPVAFNVDAGDTVVFTNAGGAAHTVTEKDKKFDSGNLDPGQTFTWKPTTAGTFTFFCTYHPWMTGTVTVTGSLPVISAPKASGLSTWSVLGVLVIGGLAMAPAGIGALWVGWLIYDAYHHGR
jgi:plastocyanin